MKTSSACLITASVAFIFLTSKAAIASECSNPAGILASAEGVVEVMTDGSSSWQSALPKHELCQNDTIRVGEKSRAALSLINNAVFRLDQNTTLKLTDIVNEPAERSFIDLVKGAIQSFSRKPSLLTVNTPYLNGSIEGTEFLFRVDPANEKSKLVVYEGTVIASNEHGTTPVKMGAVEAAKGGAPTPLILVSPRDEVQWALHYPAVVIEGNNAPLKEASELMQVGQVGKALALVEKVIAADSSDAYAYALRSVINVVRNKQEAAQADAEHAIGLESNSATRLAYSYALQSQFAIEEAAHVLRTAGNTASALETSRLAELELMLGNREQAVALAQQAVKTDTTSARAHTVLGFSELALYNSQSAQQAFEMAIEQRSSDPMARLGLGLAKIAAGDLSDGRREIEYAVALDGSNALLRSYLAKAYYEEKRAPLDEEQLIIAKELDANDPTPYLFDAVRLQSANDPIGALAQVERSIDKNDNRAVYRGRLLLDKDRAARGASLANIYNDLGLIGQGVTEASKSLTTDPSNSAAHQFLGGVYQSKRRHEVARVSEIYQAQMLQDSITQPASVSASEGGLSIANSTGTGFNEFTSLFSQNQTNGVISAFAGNNATKGGELAVASSYNGNSLSVGAMSYETDGWRENNELDVELFNAMAQSAVNDKINVQLEYRQRESTEGDLEFDFNPDSYSENLNIIREQEMARVGLKYSQSDTSHLLASIIRGTRNDERTDSFIGAPVAGVVTISEENIRDEVAEQAELQYVTTGETISVLVGASASSSDTVQEFDISVDDSIIGNLFSASTSTDIKINERNFYGFVYARNERTLLTAGFNKQDYLLRNPIVHELNKVSPKFGLQLEVSDKMSARFAAARGIKSALANNRSLEPTQIAGFNLKYDDTNGSEYDLRGLGLDWTNEEVYISLEHIERGVLEPVFDSPSQFVVEEIDEIRSQLSAAWNISQSFSISSHYIVDEYAREIGILTEGGTPISVETKSLPVALRYYSNHGFFAVVTATQVDQKLSKTEFTPAPVTINYRDDFSVVDVAIGYRLPHNKGSVTLSANNVTDKAFNYQDDSYREARDEPSTGPYLPMRTVMAKLNFIF